MPIVPREFKIGLLVTALLEDRYNKTGHIRDQAKSIANRYAAKLAPFGHGRESRVLRGRGRRGEGGARAEDARTWTASSLVEIAYQKGLIPMRALRELDVPLIVWNAQLVNEFPEGGGLRPHHGQLRACAACPSSPAPWCARTGTSSSSRGASMTRETVGAGWAATSGRRGRRRALRNAKVGLIGTSYEGMTDMMQDNLAVMETFGATCWPIHPGRGHRRVRRGEERRREASHRRAEGARAERSRWTRR